MHTIHLHDLHMPRGPNLWLAAISAVYIFSVALVLFLVFTLLGGAGFAESMGGNAGLAFLIIGLLVSALLAFIEKPKD